MTIQEDLAQTIDDVRTISLGDLTVDLVHIILERYNVTKKDEELEI